MKLLVSTGYHTYLLFADVDAAIRAFSSVQRITSDGYGDSEVFKPDAEQAVDLRIVAESKIAGGDENTSELITRCFELKDKLSKAESKNYQLQSELDKIKKAAGVSQAADIL